MAPRRAFEIGSTAIAAGGRRTVQLHVSVLSNQTPITLPVHVVHGENDGPVLFLSGVIHGDEIMGVEVARRVLCHPALAQLSGTFLAVPIVNAYGMISHSRYLPDRRDLNRSFPGSDHGSLASVLADLFMREVVRRSGYGIDIHSAALHRTNLPQIRISPGDDELMLLAQAFGAPVVLVSKLRDGSLRQSALKWGVKVLVFEGGEALRFDEYAVDAAVAGTLRIMQQIGMLARPAGATERTPAPTVSHASYWLRAPEGGIFRTIRRTGHWVGAAEAIGVISSPMGDDETQVVASAAGIIIGQSQLPVVNRGDALFHVARAARQGQETFTAKTYYAPLPDEDEII
ncbi:MAG: succinylglutamate desuccinylase/aspartoacylase family protein [Pseudomonadota bacterium]|nr:succinylglutamate desuccinylase/aspartoacylase family protein [Pseudomonadota bacterium]